MKLKYWRNQFYQKAKKIFFMPSLYFYIKSKFIFKMGIFIHGFLKQKLRRKPMLKWSLYFLIIAIIAGLLGFTGVAGAELRPFFKQLLPSKLIYPNHS
jgi:hypothetical protein